MKKLIVFILSVVYLTTSIGATFHFHYCMDRLVSWGLDFREDSPCSYCGMEKEESKGCCKDEHTQIKIKGDQKITNTYSDILSNPVQILMVRADHYQFLSPSILPVAYPESHAPPDLFEIAIYLSNCVFRI